MRNKGAEHESLLPAVIFHADSLPSLNRTHKAQNNQIPFHENKGKSHTRRVRSSSRK
jgi:hypothetical protein